MGCSGSKVDQQQPVALCRGRADLLAAALRHCFALSHSHAAYSDSLLSVANALHRLLLQSSNASDCGSSPVLPLPSSRKSSPSAPPLAPNIASSSTDGASRHSHSGSHSDSHIQFQLTDSDDDEEDSQVWSFHSSSVSSPLHHYDYHDHHHHLEEEEERSQLPTMYHFPSIYYSRSQPPPTSISVEQPPPSYETVQYGSSYFEPSYPSYGYPYARSSSCYYHGNYGSMDRFFGPSYSSMTPPAVPGSVSAGRGLSSLSSMRAPPPPSSPPRVSTWDFLNPFQSYESHYSFYTPSRSSKEIQEEEVISDLEEEEQEVVTEAYFDHMFGGFSSRGAGSADKYTFPATTSSGIENGISNVPEQPFYCHPSSAGAGRISDYEPQLIVDKNVVSDDVSRPQIEEKNAEPAVPSVSQDVAEVASEIEAQFEMAARSARELSVLLEVGNHQYQPKHSLYEGENSSFLFLLLCLLLK